MGAKKQAKPAQAEVPQAVVVATKRGLGGRKAFILAAVAGALLAGATVAWLVLNNSGSEDGPKTAKDQNVAVLKNSADLERDRNYAGQAKELQEYIDSKPPGEFAEKEIIRLAAAYQNAKDYQKAIDSYQVALDKYPNSKLAALRGLGFAYMARGDANKSKDDYRKSKQYFEQAIEVEMKDPEAAHVAGSDQNNIRYLDEMLQR